MNLEKQNEIVLEKIEEKKQKTNKKDGILIYEEARRKLQISKGGRLYKEKIAHYIPFIGPIFSLIYANLVIGKTRCLRDEDAYKFKKASSWVNWYGFLIWPIIFMGIWALLAYLLFDMGIASGTYISLWNTYINGLKAMVEQIKIAPDSGPLVAQLISVIFSGFFAVWFAPIISGSAIQMWTSIPLNLLFIACFFVFTIINPVNIFSGLIINSKKRRFVVVLENSSVFQYR